MGQSGHFLTSLDSVFQVIDLLRKDFPPAAGPDYLTSTTKCLQLKPSDPTNDELWTELLDRIRLELKICLDARLSRFSQMDQRLDALPWDDDLLCKYFQFKDTYAGIFRSMQLYQKALQQFEELDQRLTKYLKDRLDLIRRSFGDHADKRWLRPIIPSMAPYLHTIHPPSQNCFRVAADQTCGGESPAAVELDQLRDAYALPVKGKRARGQPEKGSEPDTHRQAGNVASRRVGSPWQRRDLLSDIRRGAQLRSVTDASAADRRNERTETLPKGRHCAGDPGGFLARRAAIELASTFYGRLAIRAVSILELRAYVLVAQSRILNRIRERRLLASKVASWMVCKKSRVLLPVASVSHAQLHARLAKHA